MLSLVVQLCKLVYNKSAIETAQSRVVHTVYKMCYCNKIQFSVCAVSLPRTDKHARLTADECAHVCGVAYYRAR
jgi:hypothetical protein